MGILECGKSCEISTDHKRNWCSHICYTCIAVSQPPLWRTEFLVVLLSEKNFVVIIYAHFTVALMSFVLWSDIGPCSPEYLFLCHVPNRDDASLTTLAMYLNAWRLMKKGVPFTILTSLHYHSDGSSKKIRPNREAVSHSSGVLLALPIILHNYVRISWYSYCLSVVYVSLISEVLQPGVSWSSSGSCSMYAPNHHFLRSN